MRPGWLQPSEKVAHGKANKDEAPEGRGAPVRPVPAVLPPSLDLRPAFPPVENQGALEFLEMKDKVPFMDLSRLFFYYNERVIEHTVKSDSGAMLRDGIKTLAKQGVCTEKKWPYVISRFTHRPSTTYYKEAMQHQITSYQRLLTLDEMRACLAERFLFVFGFIVYESFETQ